MPRALDSGWLLERLRLRDSDGGLLDVGSRLFGVEEWR